MARFIQYKENILNLDSVVNIKVDTSLFETEKKIALRFHTVDGFEKHFEIETLEETQDLIQKIIELTEGKNFNI